MSDATQRMLGEHEADIRALQKSVDSIAADVKAIRSTVDESRGGMKAVVFLASISGAVGGAIGWFASLLQHKPDGVP